VKNLNVAALAAIVASSGAAHGIVIGFDDLSGGAFVSNQYADATFSSDAGQSLVAFGYGDAPSPGNVICTADSSGTLNCTSSLFVSFTNPVNNLSFWAIEPNQFGAVANIEIYSNNALVGTVPLIGLAAADGQFVLGNRFVDLSAFSNVSSIAVVALPGQTAIDDSYGGNGIGFDSFSFTAVPSPSSLALLGAGSIAVARRRRR
jgi:hypothetical protein